MNNEQKREYLVNNSEDYDSEEYRKIQEELQTYQRKELYKYCIAQLRVPPRFSNLFQYCSHFVNEVVINDLFPADDDYEISSDYTKSGNPFIVTF